MNKENVVSLYKGVLLSCLKNKIMKFTGKWMKLGQTIMSEVTQIIQSNI